MDHTSFSTTFHRLSRLISGGDQQLELSVKHFSTHFCRVEERILLEEVNPIKECICCEQQSKSRSKKASANKTNQQMKTKQNKMQSLQTQSLVSWPTTSSTNLLMSTFISWQGTNFKGHLIHLGMRIHTHNRTKPGWNQATFSYCSVLTFTLGSFNSGQGWAWLSFYRPFCRISHPTLRLSVMCTPSSELSCFCCTKMAAHFFLGYNTMETCAANPSK